uniref:CCHC-type domain-containing protein n=1 Tax=Corethron hystrix TaxID=216773 RepID=A0A7S1FQI0_9STRA|mmetsp:Transcript_22810/g.52281  ORF Transcript_22810/g.52281 Transcript_22810/m.52281 type:complete len:461 (+) Transcript_22810:269-1651(+)
MAKGKKKGSRRKGSSESDSENDDSTAKTKQKDKNEQQPSLNDMNFAEKRDFRRKAASEKRRTKMVCHLCGETGHVRRECPGINDDGRGESKFTKSNGDAGATSLRQSTKKGGKNRGRKQEKETPTVSIEELLPSGFHSNTNNEDNDKVVTDPFYYIDAGCDGHGSLEYLRFGRGKNKLSQKEAISEFESTMDEVCTSTNFGSCISRSYLKRRVPFDASRAYPFATENVFFVIGLGKGFEGTKEDADLLVETVNTNEKVVGLLCNLDYNSKTDSHEEQLQKLGCTCNAASQAGCPVQIRTSPSPPVTSEKKEDDSDETTCQYSKVMVDLAKVLLDITASTPDLKVHLSCWNGKVEHMNALLQTFPENIWLGFDATVSFSKAKIVHECAFEVPLDKLLLETGEPTTIHSTLTKAKGRQAFGHPGLIPFIAQSLAAKKNSALEETPEKLARAAATNTSLLYKI